MIAPVSQEAEHGQAKLMQDEVDEHRLRAYNLWQQIKQDGHHAFHWKIAHKDALADFEWGTKELQDEREREQIEKRLADTFADLDFINVPETLYRLEDGTGTGNPKKIPIITFTPKIPGSKAKGDLQRITLNPEFVVVDLTTERTQTMLAEGAGFDFNPFLEPEDNVEVIRDIFQIYKKPLMTLGVLGFARYIEPASAKKAKDPKLPHAFQDVDVEPNSYDLLREFVMANPTLEGIPRPVKAKKATK